MIQAHELRIGNIIQYNDGDICRVIGISEFGLDVEFKEETTYIEHEHFSVIPITEEILLKCGFDLKSVPYHAIKGNIVLVISNGIWYYKFSHAKVQYLHQLQNLYHALTGQELKIEL